VEELFSVETAREWLASAWDRIDGFVADRAALAEMRAALDGGPPTALGGPAEAAHLEASLNATLAWFAEQHVEVKGWAPLLLDFPAVVEDAPALLCWVEYEPALEWWHRLDLGFAGRRRL
jgi:hypothetical protein